MAQTDWDGINRRRADEHAEDRDRWRESIVRWQAETNERLDRGNTRLDDLDRGQLHVIKRLDKQDEQAAENTLMLKEVRTILIVGKAGWSFMRWLGAAAVAAWGVYAAWRGLK